jgi:hypothetical protein
MAKPLHLFNRNRLFYWRPRLPRALEGPGAPAHLCRSLATAEPALARLRALRLQYALPNHSHSPSATRK